MTLVAACDSQRQRPRSQHTEMAATDTTSHSSTHAPFATGEKSPLLQPSDQPTDPTSVQSNSTQPQSQSRSRSHVQTSSSAVAGSSGHNRTDSSSNGAIFSSRSTAGTATTNTSTNTNTNLHLGERKSSFNVATWMRDPLAEVPDDVLHKQTTVWLAFQQIVFRTPDAIALCARDVASKETETLTWRQLHTQVLSMVKVLVHLGLGVGDGVVFSAKSSFSLYILHLATLAAGGVVSHIRPSWKPDELANNIFPNAKAKILILDSLTENFVRAIRLSSTSSSSPTAAPPHNTDVRAVVLLRGYSTERALVLNLPVSLLNMDDMRSVAHQCQATELTLLDRITGAVMPTDPCAISFDYDPHGRVRGTCVSHDNVMFTAANLARSFGPLSLLDRLVGYLPLYHIASQVIEIFMPLLCGAIVYCAPSYKGEPLVNVIKSCKPTIFFATPDTWAHISIQVYKAKSEANSFLYKWAKSRATNNSKKLRFGHDAHRSLGYMIAKRLVLNNLQKKIGLESCTACYSVLAPLDFELEKLFTTIDIPIYQLYGVPESCGFAAINFPHSWEFGTCGRALKGTVMEYDDISHELLLRGRNVFMGYIRYHGQIVPSQTSDGWLRVPQRGHLTPDGFLKINDPPQEYLVLSTGDWVPVEPFERALSQQPELERAVLVGDGRAFLSVLLFMKTGAPGAAGQQVSSGRGVSFSGGPGYVPSGGKPTAKIISATLSDHVIQLGQSIGSQATTVASVIKCQRWAVHFDRVLEELPSRVGVSGVQVRKWVLMAEEFTIDGGEIDPDTHEIKRRAVDHKYQSLLDSLYC